MSLKEKEEKLFGNYYEVLVLCHILNLRHTLLNYPTEFVLLFTKSLAVSKKAV